jgi:hypothetical protein
MVELQQSCAKDQHGIVRVRQTTAGIPAVNVSHNRFPFCTRKTLSNVLIDPLNEVVFEYTFNDLVEEIW